MFLSLIADDFNYFESKEMNYEETVLYYVDTLLN